LITVTNLIKDYKTPDNETLRILQIEKLVIEDGKMLGIYGVSGSGKTTLLHILTGLLLPTSGDVLVNDVYINRLAEGKRDIFRANNIGYIFQSFNLIPYLSARENIMLALWIGKKMKKPERERRCDELLEQTGLSKRAKHLPDELSGGEQQRVCIARALANNPSIIVADEPTANLDSQTKFQVIDLVKTMCVQNKTTLILSSHDREITQDLHEIVSLDAVKAGESC
jgi:putative ABC transport system ATP-binding protein